MTAARDYERGQGRETIDTSYGYRHSELERVQAMVEARSPGLRAFSFDIVSFDPSEQDVRFIEVKGRGTAGPVEVIPKEYQTGLALRSDYWLYVVYDCNSQPHLILLRDPMRLEWATTPRGYSLSADQVRSVGVPVPPGAT